LVLSRIRQLNRWPLLEATYHFFSKNECQKHHSSVRLNRHEAISRDPTVLGCTVLGCTALKLALERARGFELQAFTGWDFDLRGRAGFHTSAGLGFDHAERAQTGHADGAFFDATQNGRDDRIDGGVRLLAGHSRFSGDLLDEVGFPHSLCHIFYLQALLCRLGRILSNVLRVARKKSCY
jgi:hypothetical protein